MEGENMEQVGDVGSQPGKNENSGYKVGKNNPPIHTRFGNRPPPDVNKQKETKKKNRYTRDRIKALMDLPYNFPPNSQLRGQLVQAFGEKVVRKLTGMEVAALMQINKAILKGDTQSFRELNNQAYGLPKQITELQGLDGTELFDNKSEKDLKKLLEETLTKIDGK